MLFTITKPSIGTMFKGTIHNSFSINVYCAIVTLQVGMVTGLNSNVTRSEEKT